MLQNQPNETADAPQFITPIPPSTTAAQVRVTQEELTQALNALQANKEEEASRLNGTLSIGQAVDEMGLDSTPEEIWKQIQSQRLQQEQEARQKQEAENRLHQEAAHKQSLAGQAVAVAEGIAAGKLAYDAAQASKRRQSRGSRRGKHGGGFLTGLIVLGCFFFFSGHGVMVNGDHATDTDPRNYSVAMINGDSDTITYSGNCDTLIVLGDHDHLTMNGHVKHIITLGDHNDITWSSASNPEAPSKSDIGDGNTIIEGN